MIKTASLTRAANNFYLLASQMRTKQLALKYHMKQVKIYLAMSIETLYQPTDQEHKMVLFKTLNTPFGWNEKGGRIISFLQPVGPIIFLSLVDMRQADVDPRFCYQPKLGEKTGEERDLVGPPSVLIFNLSNNMYGNKSENILFFPLYIKLSYFLHFFPSYILKLQRKLFSFPFPKLFPSLPFHFFSPSSCPFHNAFLFLKKNVNKEQMKYQVKS